jgi:tetratricopeptide (TPR) repeat protein
MIFLAGLGIATETSSTHLAKGSEKLQNGDFVGAESELRQAISIGTNDPQVYNLLGFICDQTDRSREALAQYEKALALRPDFLPARNNLGSYYLRQGHPDLALDQFQSSLKIDPADVTANYSIGIIRAQEGRLEEALESISRAHASAPKDMPILVVLAKVQTQARDQNGAIGSAEKILDLLRQNPSSPDSKQVIPETAQVLASLPDKGPDEQKRTFLLAEFEFLAKDYTAAIASLNQVQEDHRDIEYYNLLGMSQAGIGNFQEARLALAKAISMDPRRADLLFNMGSVYQRARDNETAIKLFKRAIAAGDSSAETEFALALGYFNFGSYEDAIKICLHIINSSPAFDQAFLLLGRSYARLSKYADAITAIRKSLIINPECEQCYFHLALVYLDAGNETEATKLLRKVISMNPANASAHFQLGKALAKQKDKTEAIKELQRTIDLDPQQDLAYYQLGHVFLASGDRTKGEAYLAKARVLKESRRAAAEDQMGKAASSQR